MVLQFTEQLVIGLPKLYQRFPTYLDGKEIVLHDVEQQFDSLGQEKERGYVDETGAHKYGLNHELSEEFEVRNGLDGVEQGEDEEHH